MNKAFFTTGIFLLFIQSLFGQKSLTFQDSVASYFKEIKVETRKHKQLWGMDLYSPVLLVNPETRQLYANFPDTAGILKRENEIYSGVLSNEFNISNTAIDWNGRRWAMLILPLPTTKHERFNILAHELFHVHQPSLGFQLSNAENNHLDQKDGRIYLRLELEALKKALQTSNKSDRKSHLANALTFRTYRYLLYPEAMTSENLLEINEGLAEFTGFVISGRNKRQSIDHFEQSINTFLGNPSFVRSFAYHTIPVYGYLLLSIKKNWCKEVTFQTNLTKYFLEAFQLSLPGDIRKATSLIINQYNGEVIISEETEREKRTLALIAEYKNKFITQPHFELIFEQMNISFDPGNIIPIEDKGSVYTNIRVTDKWGILTVEKGALLGPNWDKISVTIPLSIEGQNINGDGWNLELTEGYSVIKDENTGNYRLKKE